jgi:putative membrane protein
VSRLHPLSVPYRAATTVSRLAWVIVLASIGSASAGFPVEMAATLVVATLALALAYQVAYYRRFEYDLAAETLDIRSGVVGRRTREIPYGRVQNVDISRNAVQRLLGIAAVDVETAGGGETEAQLRYVSDEEARRLQEALGRRGGASEATGTGDEEAAPERTPLFALSNRELVLLGAVSLDLRFVSVLFVLVSLAAPGLAARLDPMPGGTLVAAPLALVGLYVVAAVVGGAATVTNYYGFRLWRVGDDLRYERGLVQRFSGTIPLAKVQALTVSANVLARRLGYATLSIETAGYAASDADSSSVVPIAERERVLSLARSVESFDALEFERPPKRARTRYAIRYALLFGVLTAVLYGVVGLTSFGLWWWFPLLLLPLSPVAAHVKWRHRGHCLLADHVVTRNGFWTETVSVVPYYRVQNVITTATVFQRRRDLATVAIDTAGSGSLTSRSPAAVDLDAAVATELQEAVADRLQESILERRTAADRTGREPAAGSGPAPG